MCVILDSLIPSAKMCSTKVIRVMRETQESGEDSVDGCVDSVDSKEIDDSVDRKEIDEQTIKEVAANLRIIGDEINAKYTKLSFRNIVLWIRILRVLGRLWI